MKKQIMLLFFSSCLCVFAQDSLPISKIKLKSQIFSLSPISKKVDVVNGLAFGIGHFENRNIQKNKTTYNNSFYNEHGMVFYCS